ncbi:hypothetical protein [Demequina sp. NBRC 110056]|uniref:hypothetical protein n=1 Tax=Demequina sp. NBRC 110056 TaxID=1570345 RepID=UPI00117D266C|nr:hypothetical protein [Demequina sp. NBRC 110056]
MERVQIAIEVGPVGADALARLEAAGHLVRHEGERWRVIVTATVLGQHSVRAQAHVLAHDVIHDFALEALTQPPSIAIRDPDGVLDIADTEVMLDGVRRAYDPDPLKRYDPHWWQKQMELGLGERKA